MPSIPQSLLWISLVILWLFVLVPMLISKRDAVRRTSDVALATRVLNSGANARLRRRSGPAAGHASDPDWQPAEDVDDDVDEPSRSVVVAEAVVEETEPEYLDVDVVEEDAEALPAGVETVPDVAEPEAETDELPLEFDEVEEPADEPVDDGYEYVADSSGLEVPSEADLQLAESLSEARRRRYESKTAAAVTARKYRFRKRMLTSMLVALVASAVAALMLGSSWWWVCGAVGAVTVLYLGYLRRQTRIEERLRRRRAERVARSRLGVENTDDRDFNVVPARLRRPGSVVLEIDDEDPIFEHLDYAPFARDFDLPRAAGQ
ncbi:divisome protein SepX/GlpR [Mycolicibacterium sp. XJ1819]